MSTETTKNPEEQLTTDQLNEKIRKVQDWMISHGYREIDPRIHKRLALHLWRRRQDIDKGGLLLAGRTGCLAGETTIKVRTCPSREGAREYRLDYAYVAFNHVRKSGFKRPHFWKSNMIQCLADVGERECGYHQIDQIVQSGTKPVWLVTLDNGSEIKATLDHRFQTPDGYVRLFDLRNGSDVCVVIPRAAKLPRKVRPKRRTVESLRYHGTAAVLDRKIVSTRRSRWTKTYQYQRVHYARLVVEAAMNNLQTEDFIRILQTDEKRAKALTFLPSEQQVHHKDEDTMNDSIDNLEVISVGDHALHHKTNGMHGYNQKGIAKIASIVYVGKEMTYDIVMKDPHRNFVANNIIVHNSGKTLWLKTFACCDFYEADRLVENYIECHETLKDKMKVWGNSRRYSSDVVIDDFGQELSINDFGTKTEVMQLAITMRYHMFQAFGARTYISTNLTMPQIQNRYGERITSRLAEMCTVIPFNIEDQRKKS